jgi:hypothetical protein
VSVFRRAGIIRAGRLEQVPAVAVKIVEYDDPAVGFGPRRLSNTTPAAPMRA